MNVEVPLIGDFHFNGHKLLTEHPGVCRALAKLRINPGNVRQGRQARRAVRAVDRKSPAGSTSRFASA